MSRFTRIVSAMRNLRGNPKTEVGSDLEGNRYYERVTRSGKVRRSVELNIKSPDNYRMEDLPPEWTQWLRGLSEAPPTIEEQQRNFQYRLTMEHKINQLKEQEEKEALTSPSTKASSSHASQQTFDKREEVTRDMPTSSGRDFQPASWKPKSN